MNKSNQEPHEHTNVGVDIPAFVVALKEIAYENSPEAIKMLLASIHIKEDMSASEKGETTDDTQRNIVWLRTLSETARMKQQEFTAIKVLLADTRHPAKCMKQKSKEQIDETVPEDRNKNRRTRNGSNEMKDCRSADVLEVKASTSQPNGLPKYKCYFCDSSLSGLAGIQGHYTRKHEIIDPTEVLFYDGKPLFTLPSSNVNTQGGKARWFIKEKVNALEKYTAGTCRLCEQELEDPETLSKHYEINHKVADSRKVESLFRFKTGAHLDGLPTSDPRKQRQPRQTRQRHQFKKIGNGNNRRTSLRSTSSITLCSSGEDSDNDNDDSDYIDDNKEHADENVAIKRLLHCVANLRTFLTASRKIQNEEKILDATDVNAIPIITSVKTEHIEDSEETSVPDTEMVDHNNKHVGTFQVTGG